MGGAAVTSKIVIVQGHPDSARRHLCHALADAYADAAAEAGHSVTRVEIAAIKFPLLRTEEEFNSGTPPASLGPAIDAIVAANHLVMVFPLWLGTMPALVKAFLEQVMRPGVSFSYQGHGVQKLLTGRSAHIVVTMGMPAWLYRLLQPRHPRTAPEHIEVRRILTGANHNVRHDRKGFRKHEEPLARRHAPERCESAIAQFADVGRVRAHRQRRQVIKVETLAEALAEGIQTGHPTMQEFRLDRSDPRSAVVLEYPRVVSAHHFIEA
jgi:putative NADPH-quinone reductase